MASGSIFGGKVIIKAEGLLSNKEICTKLNFRPAMVWNYLTELQSESKVIQVGQGAHVKYAIKQSQNVEIKNPSV